MGSFRGDWPTRRFVKRLRVNLAAKGASLGIRGGFCQDSLTPRCGVFGMQSLGFTGPIHGTRLSSHAHMGSWLRVMDFVVVGLLGVGWRRCRAGEPLGSVAVCGSWHLGAASQRLAIGGL